MNCSPTRKWKILTWNVRGINSEWKWNPVKNKIMDSACDVIYLQETKKEMFESSFLRNISPTSIDSYVALPSVGASGGILIAWKSSMFEGQQTFSNDFAITVQFTSKHDGSRWALTCDMCLWTMLCGR